MSRKCPITQKGVLSGNNVSHAKNRTRRRFLPNLQPVSFHSDVLNTSLSMRVTAAAIRTVTKMGGIDNFVMSKSVTKLDPSLRSHRKLVEKARAAA